jgi:LysM repeat protein
MKLMLLITFIGFYFLTWAQPENAQIEVIEGKRYYIHFVQGGNTLYGIHNLYKVPVEDIVAGNPETKNGLQEGQRILIPIKGVESLPENLVLHKVESKETLYGISKKYGISIEKLTELNPGIELGLNEGQEIKIPVKMPVGQGEPLKIQQQEYKISFTDSIIKHTVLKGETLYNISKRFMVPEAEIRKLNTLRNDKIRPGDVLNIPIKKERIEKVEIRKIDAAKSKTDLLGNKPKKPIIDSALLFKKKERYTIAILMPLYLDKPEGYNTTIPDLAAEFYMGAKAALDSLQKMGLKAKVYIHDSQNDSTAVMAILKKPEFKDVDLIIGPFYGANSEYVADWCRENGVRMVCPFATNYEILRDNPFIYEAVTSDITLSEGLAKYLARTSKNEQVLLIKPTSEKDLTCYEAFRSAYIKESMKTKSPKLMETTQEDYATFIKPDVNTKLVFLSSDKTESMEFVNSLNKAAYKANNGQLSLFGTKDWVNFSAISSKYKNKYNFQFATSFDLNYNDERVKNFHKKFRVQFSADLSKMVLQGFDVTTYFCQTLLMQKAPKKGLMNDINMVQKGANNGFENTKCLIVKQEEYEIIKVAEINE